MGPVPTNRSSVNTLVILRLTVHYLVSLAVGDEDTLSHLPLLIKLSLCLVLLQIKSHLQNSQKDVFKTEYPEYPVLSSCSPVILDM